MILKNKYYRKVEEMVKKKKCMVCSKLLSILKENICRCESTFCSVHKYPSSHNCTYDYFENNKRILEKNNPVINFEKIIKI